jgi:hypothetical protein
MQRNIILFELNEVPFKILDQFCQWRPNSTLAKKLPGCFQYQTHAQEISPLSPWITWPSVHRGVNDEQHMIQNFGEDLTEVDKAFPPVWEMLRRNGVSAGICGTLHTYPIPQDVQNHSFYLPDTFAASSECFPQKLDMFQEFNLRMARESARNVARGVPWKAALKMLAHAPELGFKLHTLTNVAGQLLSERVNKSRTSRRRSYQSILAFDIFMKQLESTRPSFSSFFTNHVASSMHRFWAASFPEEYAPDEFGYTEDWINTYRHELDWSMQKADQFFDRLVKFADRHPEYQIWMTTSMGQAATVALPLETQLYIKDLAKFMTFLGFEPAEWSPRPAMAPQSNLFVSPGSESRFRETLGKLQIDGAPVNVREKDHGFFSLDMGQKNLYKGPQLAVFDGKPVSFADMGLHNEEIEDKSDCNAYHIPEGCLVIYDPKNIQPKGARPDISTLDIAPAILKNFAVPVPKYMQKPVALATSA